MNANMNLSRRHWILGSLGTIGASVAAAGEHAHKIATGAAPARFEFFDEATAREIEAIASQIIPSDDGPGAKEAGVIYFIDRALKTFDAGKQDAYRTGLTQIQQIRAKMFPESENIAALTPAQQIELMRAIEKLEFFEIVRVHTVLGFLGNPSYGGNRSGAGWKCIGFEDRMAWQPPFGFYDAEDN